MQASQNIIDYADAQSAWHSALAMGTPPEVIVSGAERYLTYCRPRLYSVKATLAAFLNGQYWRPKWPSRGRASINLILPQIGPI